MLPNAFSKLISLPWTWYLGTTRGWFEPRKYPKKFQKSLKMKFVHMNIWLLKRSKNVSLNNEKKNYLWPDLASGLDVWIMSYIFQPENLMPSLLYYKCLYGLKVYIKRNKLKIFPLCSRLFNLYLSNFKITYSPDTW